MASSNPVLKESAFQNSAALTGGRMTIEGTAMKTAALVFLVVCAGAFTWSQVSHGENFIPWLLVGLGGGLIAFFATLFKAEWAVLTAPAYALAKGLVLGAASAFFQREYPGIVLNAVGLTLGVLLIMISIYRLGLLQATPAFVKGVFCATAAIALFYLVTLSLRFYGVSVPLLHEGSLLGIGLSVVIVGVAALNMIVDFGVIKEGAENGAPQYMEWYAAFGCS